MLPESPPFPFIVGCGRSGTTLLRSMLDSHPEMAVPGESNFILRRRKRYETNAGFATGVFLDDLFAHPRFQRWGLSRTDLVASLQTPPVDGYADAIRRVYAVYAKSRGKARYADKTPAFVLAMPLLAERFPEARFLHLIRDGRDVALSYMSIHEWGPNDIAECALYWRHRVNRGRKDGAALGSQRYREVHYEKLVEDPTSVLRELCSFVDLEYDDRMLQYHERAAEVLRLELQPHRHQGLRLPPKKGLRDWRHQMHDSDVAIFEVLCGKLLSDLGYERRFDSPGARIKVRAAGLVAATTIHRLKTMARAGRAKLLRTQHRRETETFGDLEAPSRTTGR